eukprot:CFRG0429T1
MYANKTDGPVPFSKTQAAKLHLSDTSEGQEASITRQKVIIGAGICFLVTYCYALYQANKERRLEREEMARMGIEEVQLTGEEAFRAAMQSAGERAASRNQN